MYIWQPLIFGHWGWDQRKLLRHWLYNSICLTVLSCSFAKSCLTLWNPMDYSTPLFPVHHLLEFAQIHVHWVIEAIQPSYLCRPLLLLPSVFPASGSFQMSQFFASGGQSIRASASVLPMNIQDWFPLGLTGWISLLFKGLARVFSSTTVWRHQFFNAQPFLWSSNNTTKISTCLRLSIPSSSHTVQTQDVNSICHINLQNILPSWHFFSFIISIATMLVHTFFISVLI